MSRQQGTGRTGDPDLYKYLSDMNAAYQQVIASLSAFQRNPTFDRKQLKPFTDMVREARACSNAYLTGVLEDMELAEAGRYFRKRIRREHREESGQ